MTRTPVFLHGAIAVIVALGICGQPNLKAQDAAGPIGGVVRVGPAGVTPGDSSDAKPAMYLGTVYAGATPPQGNPTPTWPCYGGDSQCSSIPAGGFVVPLPLQVVSTKDIGEVVWTFTSVSASGTADCEVKVTQGKRTISTFSFSFTGVAPNGTYYAYAYGQKFSGAKTGTAKVTVTTTVGSATITGHAVLHVE
jgi:hypothetical protein